MGNNCSSRDVCMISTDVREASKTPVCSDNSSTFLQHDFLVIENVGSTLSDRGSTELQGRTNYTPGHAEYSGSGLSKLQTNTRVPTAVSVNKGPARPLPRRLRCALPVLVAADLALLFSAHVSRGVSTLVDGEAPFGLLKPHMVSEDNLVSAVGRLANAGAWLLVVIVAGLSGLLPYVKLLGTLLVSKLVDKGAVATDRGYKALRILEIAGKYSFADVFLICFNLVIFDIATGRHRTLLFFDLELSLWMHLKLGSVFLLVSITVSAFLTCWSAHELAATCAPPQAVADNPCSTRKTRERACCSAFVATTGVFTLMFGMFLPAIFVERGGFLGKLIQPQGDRDLRLSVYMMVVKMRKAAEHHIEDSQIITLFVIMFVFLAFVMPLMELLLLIARGGITCSQGSVCAARRCHICAEWCHSFNCLDVLLLVSIFTVIDLKTAVEFNVGDECAAFESIINNKKVLSVAGLGFAASDDCFLPVSSLKSGFWVLLLTVVLRSTAWRVYGRAP